MKTLKLTLSVLLFTILFACPSDDTLEDLNQTSTVYNNDSFVEITTINGTQVTITAFTDGVTSATNTINVSNFGSSLLSSFKTGAAVPVDNTVSINGGVESVKIILNNGTEVPPFFAGGNLGPEIDAGDGVIRQDFRYNFTYPSGAPPIVVATDINRIELVYSFEYSSGGNVIHNKLLTHTIFFN